jgi:hypothetical protein
MLINVICLIDAPVISGPFKDLFKLKIDSRNEEPAASSCIMRREPRLRPIQAQRMDHRSVTTTKSQDHEEHELVLQRRMRYLPCAPPQAAAGNYYIYPE